MSYYKDQILEELVQVKRPDIPELIKYLEESDFFTAPASTRYHDSEPGGLAYHSWTVFRLFKHKNGIYKLDLPGDTIRIAGLLHDACKINYYKMGKKWYKDESTNWKWAQQDVWQVEDQFPVGHGEKSVIVLQKYIALTEVEILLIRWHMSSFDAATHFYPHKFAFNDALEKCPGIVALASADWESRIVPEERASNG